MAKKSKTKKEVKKKNEKKKTGRKPVQIDLLKVETMASQFFTHEEMCANLGISRETFYKNVKKNTDITDAIKRGQEKGRGVIKGKFWEKILEGNMTAIIFALKVHSGWKEQDTKELEKAVEKSTEKVLKNQKLWNLQNASDKMP